jgi:hypothetical protein
MKEYLIQVSYRAKVIGCMDITCHAESEEQAINIALSGGGEEIGNDWEIDGAIEFKRSNLEIYQL